jgi:tRNA nucleotidyltransferase (CCA-adding enzyme)
VIDHAARHGLALEVRFAALMHDLGKGTTPQEMLPRHIGHEQRGVALVRDVCMRLRVPNECRDLALSVTKLHGKVCRALEMRPDTVLQLLHEVDALRQPQRFEAFLLACECDARGRTGFEDAPFPQADYLRRALAAAAAVDAGAVARQYDSPEKIRAAVFQAREKAVAEI